MGQNGTTSRNWKFAAIAAAYLAALYGTLGVTPDFFRWLLRTLGRDAYSLSISAFLLCCAALILFRWRHHLARLTTPRALGLACVAVGYVAVSYTAAAAKRLHTLQYGLLVWLIMEALRGRMPLARVYGLAALMTIVAAGLDETIQAWLPNRHGNVGDVLLDGFSILLAQATLLLVRDAPRVRPFESEAEA